MSLVKSMTGYGRAVETVNGREFTVELRSVNNRYLDCTVKLPRSLSFGEDAVKQAVKNTISRGKVDVFLSVRSEGAADVKVTLNESVVAGYLASMKQMAENFDVKRTSACRFCPGCRMCLPWRSRRWTSSSCWTICCQL